MPGQRTRPNIGHPQGPARWLVRRPQSWLAAVRSAALDLSGPYRAAYDAAVPDAKRVADPFHVVRLANIALDEVRRRVQNLILDIFVLEDIQHGLQTPRCARSPENNLLVASTLTGVFRLTIRTA